MPHGFHFMRDASDRLVAAFHSTPPYEDFDRIARYLLDQEGATIIQRLDDGLDTQYWDFRIRGVLVTLHVDWTGLDLSAAEPGAEPLIHELAPRIAAFLRGGSRPALP